MKYPLVLIAILPLVALTLQPEASDQPRSTGAALSASDDPVGPVPGPGVKRIPITNPYANDQNAEQVGRRLFNSFNCSGCHGDHAGGGMGPSLRDEVWIYGGTGADIYDSIAEGRANGMPAWGTLLPPGQIWELVSYVQSLRTAHEPQPPAP
jgi:cytochrome c oxidase cbb3-type subunit 3